MFLFSSHFIAHPEWSEKGNSPPPPDLMTLIFPILLNIVSLTILDVSISQPLSHMLDRTNMKAYVTTGRHQLT